MSFSVTPSFFVYELWFAPFSFALFLLFFLYFFFALCRLFLLFLLFVVAAYCRMRSLPAPKLEKDALCSSTVSVKAVNVQLHFLARFGASEKGRAFEYHVFISSLERFSAFNIAGIVLECLTIENVAETIRSSR